MRTWKRHTLSAVLVLGVGFAPQPGPGAPREAEAAGCDARISCGSGCTATLQLGVCVPIVEYQGEIGETFWIGPRINILCDICECWYVFTSSSGSSRFMRKVGGGCYGTLSIRVLRKE